MAKTITLTIPHRLTQEEVRRRVQAGVAEFRDQFAGQVAHLDERWAGNIMDFRFGVLGQSVTGRVDIQPSQVVLNVDLPWVLAALADRIRPQIERRATRLLEAPPPAPRRQ